MRVSVSEENQEHIYLQKKKEENGVLRIKHSGFISGS